MRKLYIKQKVFKILDHYEVYDENQNPVYQVDQNFKLFGHSVNVQSLIDGRCFNISRGVNFFLARYEVNFSDGTSIYVDQEFSFFKKKIKISSDKYDLTLRGNFLDLDFEIYNGPTLVGMISKKFLAWGDTYQIKVIYPEFEEELLALHIAVDDLLDMQKYN